MEPTLASLQQLASANLLAGGLLVVVVALILQLPSYIHYLHFFTNHTRFFETAQKGKRSVFTLKAPWPWAPPQQTFLLSVKLAKGMFTSSPALDHRDSIDEMHEYVWDVPRKHGYEVTRNADKIMGRHLTKTKIGSMISIIEDKVLEDVACLRKSIGPDGARIPFGHRTWSLLWNSSLGALFGDGLDPTWVRGPAREMMHNANVCYLIDLLPFLPRAFWFAVLPKARAFRRGRRDLHSRLAKWLDNDDAVSQADNMMQEIGKMFNSRRDECNLEASSAWVAMLVTGLAVNTGEVTGWLFPYLLRSPALLKAIRAECDALPSGRLDQVDLKGSAPLLSSAIQETLRIRGSIFSGRTVKKPFHLPGYDRQFKKGDLLRIMSPGAALDTDCWGDDAAVWRGDRFYQAGDQMYNSQLAFGGGATTCPGRWLATAELLIVTAHLIRNFDFGTDVTLHEKLPDKGDDTKFGAPCKAGTGEVVKLTDLDGKSYKIVMPSMENSGCEIPSGLLPPLEETVIFMKPRDIDV